MNKEKILHPRFPRISPRVFSYWRFLLSFFLIIIGIGFLIFFLFAPRENNKDTVLFVLDTSLSMAVEDISYSGGFMSRLDFAKILIGNIISRENIGSYGLITYAKTSSMRIPFSHDRGLFLDVLRSIEPTFIYGGSDPRSGLLLSQMLYFGFRKPFHIVLITDGGDTGSGSYPEIPTYARLSIVGIGTLSGGYIPLGYNLDGEKRFKYYEGSPVISKLDKNTILSIARFYDAQIFLQEQFQPDILLHPLFYTKIFLNSILYIGSLLIILGFSFRPYAMKH